MTHLVCLPLWGLALLTTLSTIVAGAVALIPLYLHLRRLRRSLQ